ncbi:MAG: hypothetical protein PUF16_04100 [Lachnospiraceae bacterium]|nr:hypothetical protein [Lachnospiraceae bacterium]
MKVYIIDYKSVGAEGVREIEKSADGDAVFFITGDPTKLPVQINSILDKAESKAASEKKSEKAAPAKKAAEKKAEPEKKNDEKAAKIAPDVLKKARNAFAQAAKKSDDTDKKKAEKKPEKKSEKKSGTNLTDEQKSKLKEAVKPAGLKAIEYARLYKAVSESADKNEYNIALTRNFKIQKKANDIYRLTRPVFEEIKGN